MDIGEKALEYIRGNPLAREILLSLTKDPDTIFMRSSLKGSQAGVISTKLGSICSDDYATDYVGERAKETAEVLKRLERLKVLEGWITGCSSPSFYKIACEEFSLAGVNESPEIRQELHRVLS